MASYDPLLSFTPWMPKSAAQRFLSAIAAGRTNAHLVILVFQSAKIVTSLMTVFRFAAVPRQQAVAGDYVSLKAFELSRA